MKAQNFVKYYIKAKRRKVKTAQAVAAGVVIAGDVLKAAAVVGLPLFLIAPGKPSKRQKAIFGNRTYAHRGLHTKDKSVPENSLKAFKLAAEAGYGVELDVRLTKDGKVVVFHDDDLERVCGVKCRVDKKTFEELQELRLCGTDERIPLFTDVLKTIDGRGPIVVELKNGKHNKELCKKTYDILCTYDGPVCIESFDPTIVRWFKLNAPDMLRGQLATHARDYKGSAKFPLNIALSRGLTNVLCRPQFIAYEEKRRPLSIRIANAMGAMDVAWTVRDKKREKRHESVIFEHYTPEINLR